MDAPTPKPYRGPERIGRYRILGRLGKGAMGIVYRAQDDDLGRQVAVKVMTADAEGDDTARERFLREARVTGRLLHRNIVTVFNAGEDDGRHFIVMEYLEGQTLKEWLKSPHTIEEKLDLMIQTCDGLSVAHAAGVIHRDVKPSNLFVLPDGTLKILDFGVARLIASNVTRSGLIIGTPGYMSPEQARGMEVDQQSDVFSAAAVFYLMLAGREPFEGPDLPVVLQHVIHDDPPALPADEALGPLHRMVMRGLQKAADARFATLSEFVADLTRFKRQYEADTRRIVTTARTQYRQVIEQRATIDRLREPLGLAASALSEATAVLVERYPGLPGGGPAWSRPQAMAAVAELGTLQTSVETELGALAVGSQALERAEAALAAGLGADALPHLEVARQRLGADVARVQAATSRAQGLAGEQDARQKQVRSLTSAARTAAQVSDWEAAERLAAEALTFQADATEATMILGRAKASRTEETESRARKVEELADQTIAAIKSGQLIDAERLLDAARQIDPANTLVATSAAQLDRARRKLAERQAGERAATEAISAARLRFQTGDRDGAIASLDALLRGAPAAPGVADEMQRLCAEQARIEREAAVGAEVQALLAQAELAWKQGDADGAAAAAGRALALKPDDPRGRQVLDQAQGRIRELAEQAARRTQADQALAQAVASMARGRFDHAVQEADRALALQANRSDIRAVQDDAVRLVELASKEEARELAVRMRAREIEELLHQARVGLQTHDVARALAAAEEAASLDGAHAGVALVLAQARAVSAATEALASDQTVRVSQARSGPVALSTPPPWRVTWVRWSDRVLQWRRIWQSLR